MVLVNHILMFIILKNLSTYFTTSFSSKFETPKSTVLIWLKTVAVTEFSE